jgi:hypothetical protein
MKSLTDTLSKLKIKLIRRRVYNRALTSMERGIVYLVERLKVNPVSFAMIKAITGIIAKARAWIRPSKYARAMEIGKALAQANSLAAIGWGLDEAASWPYDQLYVLFLGWNQLAGGWRR